MYLNYILAQYRCSRASASLLVTVLLLLFPLFSTVNAQSFCGTPPTSDNMLMNGGLGGFNETGPFHIRIYVHVIRRSDGTGGQSYADVQQALSFLDTDFNPHNIFFEWDGCVDYIDNDSYFSSPSTAIYSVNNHYDGIDIYLYDDNAAAGGRANGVGSSSEFWVSGSYWDPPFSSLVKSHVISHEMGHVLFLWHTHHGCESGNWEATNGSNCDTAGDFVCDTPSDPHLNFNVDPSNCEWNGQNNPFCTPPEPLSAYNPDEHIIMAYTHPDCMDYFTAGQGQRMRDAIATLPFLQATLVNGENPVCGCSQDIHIYENTLYDTDEAINGDIYVHTGAKLTITSTVAFGEDKGIIVERGAKLHVDGGKLTKCPEADDWRGIEVEGNKSLPQPGAFSMPASNEAGVVLINNNAQVEWARTAIHTIKHNQSWNQPYWGGMIHCENATFVKNRRVAAFMKYDLSNNSKFINCTMNADGVGDVGVTIWDTDDVMFSKCRFYNMPDEGILVYDAGAIVKGGNDFMYNTRGIASRATYPFAAYLEVGDTGYDPNYFLDNTFDIVSYASDKLDGLRIENNQFFDALASIWLVGPSKFFIEDNSIDLTSYGVFTYQTGSLGNNQHNYIRYNGISSNAYGVSAFGENRELQVLCNNFSANTDFRLSGLGNVPGEIRMFQGSFTAAADNCFTNPQQNSDILTSGQTNHFYYYIFGEEPCKIPVTAGNYTKLNAFAPGCSGGGFITDPTYDDYYAIKAQIESQSLSTTQEESELYDLKEEKEYIFLQLLEDHLEAGEITAAIELMETEDTPSSALMKYGLLINEGMYNDALTTLNALPSSEYSEMSTFKSIQYINIDRLQQGLTYVLSESDSLFLESIALSDMGVKAYARSLLSLLTDREFTDAYPETGGEGAFATPPATTPDAPEMVRVFPNPAKERFSITIPGSLKVAAYNVVSVIGRVTHEGRWQKDAVTMDISCSNWQNGVYWLNLTDSNGKIVHTEVISINK